MNLKTINRRTRIAAAALCAVAVVGGQAIAVSPASATAETWSCAAARLGNFDLKYVSGSLMVPKKCLVLAVRGDNHWVDYINANWASPGASNYQFRISLLDGHRNEYESHWMPFHSGGEEEWLAKDTWYLYREIQPGWVCAHVYLGGNETDEITPACTEINQGTDWTFWN